MQRNDIALRQVIKVKNLPSRTQVGREIGAKKRGKDDDTITRSRPIQKSLSSASKAAGSSGMQREKQRFA